MNWYFLSINLEAIIINNENYIIKARVDYNINCALKEILEVKKISQQDLVESLVKNYVLENINIILSKSKGFK